MIGSGDPFSTAAAEAFLSAATDNQIDVCSKANYQAGSGNMKAPIKQIMDARCCLVTVVFGKPQDLAALLLEAHKQNYDGEWVMGENIMASLDGIFNYLERNLDEPSSVHGLLTGMFDLISKEVLRCFCESGTLARNHYDNTIVCSMPLALSHLIARLHVDPHDLTLHVANLQGYSRSEANK